MEQKTGLAKFHHFKRGAQRGVPARSAAKRMLDIMGRDRRPHAPDHLFQIDSQRT